MVRVKFFPICKLLYKHLRFLHVKDLRQIFNNPCTPLIFAILSPVNQGPDFCLQGTLCAQKAFHAEITGSNFLWKKQQHFILPYIVENPSPQSRVVFTKMFKLFLLVAFSLFSCNLGGKTPRNELTCNICVDIITDIGKYLNKSSELCVLVLLSEKSTINIGKK